MLQVAVVHHDRQRHDDLPARMAQRLERVRVGVQHLRGAVDLLEHVVERVVVNARRRARFEGRSDAAGGSPNPTTLPLAMAERPRPMWAVSLLIIEQMAAATLPRPSPGS